MQQSDFDFVAANVTQALEEDLGSGDITAELIPAETQANAEVISRQSAIICGRPWVDEVFRRVDESIELKWRVSEGEPVEENQIILCARGPARGLLTAERTALNFLQTLSGTATRTHHYAQLIEHTRAKLLDTRKTIPGLRHAQKYAVSCGGGHNHRIGLFDAFLVKENHITACGSITGAVTLARTLHPDKRIEVEVENLDQFRQCLEIKPDWIMLDNFSLADLKRAVALLETDIKLEASGGIEDDAELIQIAETGVHYISVGALTKHCDAVDLSMRLL
ncbi:MAG: carboxylating nicotinate-nucleotide diphosphorylase [Pseudomonadales bacterium]